MEAHDFLIEIRKYLEAKHENTHKFSPTIFDPNTLGLQMAIFEKTNTGVERKFDLIIKDREEQIKNQNNMKETNLLELITKDKETINDYLRNVDTVKFEEDVLLFLVKFSKFYHNLK